MIRIQTYNLAALMFALVPSVPLSGVAVRRRLRRFLKRMKPYAFSWGPPALIALSATLALAIPIAIFQ